MKSYTTTSLTSSILLKHEKTSRLTMNFKHSQGMIIDLLARSFYVIDKAKHANTKFLGSIPHVHVKPAKRPQFNLDLVGSMHLMDFSMWIPNGAYHFTVRWDAITDVFDIELLAGSREHAKPFCKTMHIDKLGMLDTRLACYIHDERGTSSSDCGVYLAWHAVFLLIECASHFIDPRLKKMFDANPNITSAEINIMLSRMPSRDIYDALLNFRNADESVYDMLDGISQEIIGGDYPGRFKESEYTKLEKRMVKRLAAGPITFGDLLRLFAHKGTF